MEVLTHSAAYPVKTHVRPSVLSDMKLSILRRYTGCWLANLSALSDRYPTGAGNDNLGVADGHGLFFNTENVCFLKSLISDQHASQLFIKGRVDRMPVKFTITFL